MLGTKSFALSLVASAALWAQTEYLPLQSGNTWVYRSATDSFTVEVSGPQSLGGIDYYAVRGFPSTPNLLLRNTPEGRIMMYDTAAKMENVWLDTSTPVAAESPTGVDVCNNFSRVESREAKYNGPIGEFVNALKIRYAPAACADAGVESDTLLPWVGIVERSMQTIAGPRAYSLIYARINGVTVLSAPERGFSIAVSQTSASIDVRLTLRNTTKNPLTLDFPSGQRFDLNLYDSNGKSVYTWSADKLFPAVMGQLTVQGEKTWLVEIPAKTVEPGRYAVRAWLTSTGGEFTASALIDVN